MTETQTKRKTVGSLEVHPLCLGGNVFGWTADEEQSYAVLDRYAEAGGNFIDTADAYGSWVEGNPPGASEQIIGRWMKSRGNRNEMVVATKVGMMPDRKGLGAANIKRAAEESLQRLGTDWIDLYYAHEDDPMVDIGETLGAFDGLIKEGKVREIAASNYSAPRLREALATSAERGLASYVALQTHYNLVERDLYEGDLEAACAEAGIGCLPYYSLASGFLTGKYRPNGSNGDSVRSGVAGGYLENHAAVLPVLDRIGAERRVGSAAVALAWLAAKPTVATPIASARTADQVDGIVEMAGFELSAREVAELDQVTA